ncbi:hypothetical protein [Nocardia sp. NPDC060259]|uniref:hypothetical protein n=1 Tax=Nocardia sp. NPDC060259 TaxID=3347088 RepID=UPI00365AFBD4
MEKPNYRGFNGVTGNYIAKVKASARARRIPYDVTAEQLWDIWVSQSETCVYTGRALTLGIDASLDRIDSTGGYVPGNLQWLHKNVNKIKWEMTEHEFLSICLEIVRHTGTDEFRKLVSARKFDQDRPDTGPHIRPNPVRPAPVHRSRAAGVCSRPEGALPG